MKIVSNELKNALKQPTTQRKGRILVNGNYYEVYNVEYYADAYNEGNVIGNAIASQLDFDLPYMDKFETFKYYDGVWTGAEYEYVDMGTFTVFDEQDEDEFNKHITAFDNLIKFNQPFQDVGGYPKTLYQELENICSQAEVELQNESIPNGSFVVENNQFVEGENLKVVLKAIEQISGTYGIIKNDKLVLQLKNQTSEEINKNEHEPITWKRRTYGINQVVLGMEDVQGEYVLRQDAEDIAINGVHKLVINDNPFVYTQQKREQVIENLFNQVKGFGYVPYDLKMEWLNYMDIGDIISIDGIETIILRMYGKSPKSLESEMSAPAIIDSAVEYSNNTFSLTKRVSRTEFGVDKNAREIQGIIETTETIQKEINPTKDESSSNIYIEDASNNPLIDFEIEGKSEQETRSGKNLFKTTSDIWRSAIPTYNNIDDTFTFHRDSGADYLVPYGLLNLKPNTTYTLYFDVIENTMTNTFSLVASSYLLGHFSINAGSTGVVTAILNTGENAKTYDLWFYCNSTGNLKTKIMLIEGTTIGDYEPYGVSPSPDYPSEIESVGYENFIDISTLQKGYVDSSGGITIPGTGWYYYERYSNFIKVKPNTAYFFKIVETSNTADNWIGVGEYTTDDFNSFIKRDVMSTVTQNYIKFTTTETTECIVVSARNLANATKILLIEGNIEKPYISFGKYGIEVETVGENLFDGQLELGIYSGSTGKKVDNSDYVRTINYIPVKELTSYKFSSNGTGISLYIYEYKEDYSYNLSSTKVVNSTEFLTTESETKYITFRTYSQITDTSLKIMMNKGTEIIPYKPYQSNTSLIVLNEPLRSLPNGVKDLLYIKNNRLYVDRYVGKVVLDGSEEWQQNGTYKNVYFIENYLTDATTIEPRAMLSDYFNYGGLITTGSGSVEIGKFYQWTLIPSRLILGYNSTSLEEFKTWLSTHNTQVDYELAEPYTEELGEIEIPSTFKGVTNISTTDNLEPVINLTYVRDTIIADYVENHVAELKITENEIKESVESVSSSVDGLGITVNRVEEITTDNSQVISVISTNIDKTTGEVREVTTTTGFTFNKDGMTIDDGSGFKAEHTASGTYYKDGTSIVGQYTKDGSKQKDLELFGIYSYGKNDLPDTPMFIAQLFTDANGDEGFGHFYNGGDY